MKIKILLFLVAVTVLFTGCSGEKTTSMDQMEVIQGFDEHVPIDKLTMSFYDDISYKVEDIAWTDEKGVAEVIVTTPDFESVLKESIEIVLNEHETEDFDMLLEKVKEQMQNMFESEDCPILENVIEMEAEKTKDGYILISNDEFEKIISGNVDQMFIETLVEGFVNENEQ